MPRVGYRFTAGVREVWDEDADLVVENCTRYRVIVKEETYEEEHEVDEARAVEPRALPVPLTAPRRRLKEQHIILAVSLMLVGLAATLAWTTGKTGRDEIRGGARTALSSIAAADDKSGSIRGVPEGPFLLEQAYAGGLREGRRAFPAGDQSRPGLRTGLRRARRLLRFRSRSAPG